MLRVKSYFSYRRFVRGTSLLCVVLLSILLRGESYGQGVTATAGNFNQCDAECCIRFDIVIPDGETVKTLGIQLNSNFASNDDCFNWDCLRDQVMNLNPAAAFSHPGLGTFNLTWGGNGITGPASFTIYLCDHPNRIGPSCASIFQTFSFGGLDNSTPPQAVMLGSDIPLDGPCGAGDDVNCSGCDKFWLDFKYRCALKFCFRRAGTVLSSPTCSLRVTFKDPNNPAQTLPLTDCITQGPAPGCANWTANGIEVDGGGWTINPHKRLVSGLWVVDSIDFYAISPTPCIGHCHTFCFRIPKCFTDRVTKVEIFDINDPQASCGAKTLLLKEAPSTFTPSLVYGEGSATMPNYPNPLTKQSDFKTKIPFTLQVKSDARIRIVDESGKLIHTETENFNSTGTHFFFFTGEQLPSGRYFYTIESPLGNVIVNRTLLIVK